MITNGKPPHLFMISVETSFR
uniref:Uncharacterized protein n=1 Tax=Arundo donax TaxID=35708 RepID=A0A0A8YJZ2_ARUDO